MYLVLVILAVSVTNIYSQVPELRRNISSCTPLTLEDLGSRESLSSVGLVARANARDGEIPVVKILEHQVVCEASGLTRGSVSATSVVVRFETIQYINIDCNEQAGRSEGSFLEPQPTVQIGRTINPANLSSLMLTTNTMCGLCSDNASTPNHCLSCDAACNEGQSRCVGRDSDQCCNWYLNDTCTATCPSPLVGNTTTFNCDCPRLTLQNGSITYTNVTSMDSVATHTCDTSDGYVLSNSSTNTRTCTMGGWSGPEITCQLFDCERDSIVAPTNGNHTLDQTTFGSKVSFTCETNYTLIGNATRTCELTGWSGSNPTCEFDCGSTDIVAPARGHIGYFPPNRVNISYPATILGSTALFSCDNGFTLVGNVTRTCELTGWSGNNPSCVFDCGCTDILRLNNGSIILSDSTTLNSVARFQCDSNFELFGDATRTCQLAGWSGSNPSCVFDCDSTDIISLENGNTTMLNGTTLGSVVSFSCNAKYRLEGNATRTCQLKGWSGSNPSCVFDCGSNLTLENGMVRYISEKTTLGSVAIFICNNDYRRNGNANRTCELSGWSGSNPTCDNVPGIGIGFFILGVIITSIIISCIIIVVILVKKKCLGPRLSTDSTTQTPSNQEWTIKDL